MKASKFAIAALLFALPFASSARADTAGISFVSPGTEMNNALGFSLGYSFVVNAPITVTALGYFDDGGLRETHSVGLYDQQGDLLASTNVSGNGLQQGFFNYNTITPVTLLAGGTYEVMGASGLLDNYSFYTQGFTSDPRINFLHDSFGYGNSLQFGTYSENVLATDGGGWFGANLLSTSAAVTPEPSSLLFLATGTGALAGLMRRRVRA